MDCFSTIEREISSRTGRPYVLSDKLNNALSSLMKQFRSRWKEVHRTQEKFLSRFEEWLNFPVIFIDEAPKEPSTAGRVSSEWEDLSDRSKRRRTENVRSEFSAKELAYATQMSFRASGQLDASKLVKDVAEGSPSKSTRYLESMKSSKPDVLSPDEALSLLVECKLSKSQYKTIRSVSIAKNSKLYPSYEQVQKAKEKCYPEGIVATESGASVSLQALLNHTTERIIMSQSEVIKSLCEKSVADFDLICKWGCDGTSGQSAYKQKFSDAGSTSSDENIFFISLVPLQLVHVNKETNTEIIVWKNPRTSSTRFCRPIKVLFLHETAEVTRKEVELIKEEEAKLEPFEIIMFRKTVTVNFKLAFTMVDGKVINSITNTSSSMRCYLCNSTSKQFNDIDAMLKKPIDENNLQFGISSLHAWIRMMECCLHLSYKLSIKNWQARKEDKKIVEEEKKKVQQGFRERLGLIVDQPKQSYGSSNDGNTARRFFENSEISASITGVDKDIIQRFHVILQTLSCGYKVDVQKFQKYTEETARKFVDIYPWFCMPTTVHKILIHGHQIVNSLMLPIGQMSEEAQESCNKDIKKFRENFARKCDREKNVEDVFRRLLITSDPIISSLRKLPKKKLHSLSPDAIELLDPLSVAEVDTHFVLHCENDEDDEECNSDSD